MTKPKKKKSQGLDLWIEFLAPEKNFFVVSFIYACGISLLSLAIPISVQALVNTVTFAVLMQPLLVVTFLLLILLIFSGFLNGLQDYAVEYFQRHFYARSSLEMSQRLLNSRASSLKGFYRGDLVNRYFDIMSVQKKGAKLMVGGFSLILQTMVGMLLLAFYHPYFLAFDLILVFLIFLVWALFGKKALDSAIVESKAKYKVASWLEQLASENKFFKNATRKKAAKAYTNSLVDNYLEKRAFHFRYLFRQIIFLLGIYAFLSALILGLGGFLVMEGQLTLGQLVAAEIVVAVILSGFAKSGDYLESMYDLHASLDKIADFTILEEEDLSGTVSFDIGNGDLSFDQVSIDVNNYSYTFHADFKGGAAYLINEDFDATQRVFLELSHGDLHPQRGKIYLGATDCQEINPCTLREHLYIVDEPTILEGSILQNIIWGLENVSDADVNEVLDLVGLSHYIETLPEGKNTQIWPGTSLLFWGESIRMEMARALLKKPTWVIISSLFLQLPRETQNHLLNVFKKRGIGVIVFSTGYGETPKGFDAEFSFQRAEKKLSVGNQKEEM
ncbi:unnamed protein product [Chrysoparadoxa australica]